MKVHDELGLGKARFVHQKAYVYYVDLFRGVRYGNGYRVISSISKVN